MTQKLNYYFASQSDFNIQFLVLFPSRYYVPPESGGLDHITNDGDYYLADDE